MPKRLAITIAGAVSLGSYEAGVLYEVLDAIHQHNCSEGVTDDEKILIDVMTGASAGAMTAAIVAHKMLYSANEFRGPYDNPLYNVWVKRIDLGGLLTTVDETTGDVEPPLRSIFSSNMVEGIAKDTLLGRYATGEWPAPITHMAAARSISIGMTLTNLNGVDYGYDMQPCGKFIYTRHEDQMTRVVSVEKSDKPEVWHELADASVASGAYPLAFRAKEMDRRRGSTQRTVWSRGRMIPRGSRIRTAACCRTSRWVWRRTWWMRLTSTGTTTAGSTCLCRRMGELRVRTRAFAR